MIEEDQETLAIPRERERERETTIEDLRKRGEPVHFS
jgi:hypothetical protein